MGGILPEEVNRKLAEGKNRSSQLEFEPLGVQWHQFSYLSSVVTTAQIQEWKMQLFSFIYQKKKHSVSTYFMSGTILGSEDIIMNKNRITYSINMAVYVSIFPFTCQTLCKNNEENGKMPSILHLSTKIDIISRFQIATAKSI